MTYKKRCSAKVSWESICLPKEGGLGLQNFVVWNKALNLKLVWLLFSFTSSLWVAWTKERRLKRRIFWSLEMEETDSWIWKSLLSLRHLAGQLISCSVGDGRNISFWYDNWSDHGPLILFIGANRPLHMGIPDQSSLAETLMSRDWQAPSRTHNINISLIRATLRDWPQQTTETEPESFLWGPPNNCFDAFSAKDTWDFLRPRAEIKDWSTVVWLKQRVPKHAFNFFVANLNRLPVNERLFQWGLMDNGMCTLCSSNDETRDHLFLNCNFAVEIWDRVKHRLGNMHQRLTIWQDLIQWLLATRGSTRRKILHKIVCQTTIYLVWKERNDRKHGRPPSTSQAIFTKIDRVIKDTLLARRHNKGCGTLLSLWLTYS